MTLSPPVGWRGWAGAALLVGSLLWIPAGRGQSPLPAPPPPPPVVDEPPASEPADSREAEPAPPGAAAPPEGSVSVAEAGSEPPPERRDPFWPVGYVPRRKQPATVAERPVEQPPPASAWEEARKHLDFRGSTRIGQERNSAAEKYLAIVNGKVVEAGDIVSTLYEGRLYRWRIEAIGPHGITLAKLDVRTP